MMRTTTAVAFFVLTTTASAQVEDTTDSAHGIRARQGRADRDPFEELDPADRSLLVGNSLGIRDALEQLGATFELALITDTSWPFSGGLNDRVTSRTLLDLGIELDLERALNWSGTHAFIEFYSLFGRPASADVGDIQTFSNIDQADLTQLAVLWI